MQSCFNDKRCSFTGSIVTRLGEAVIALSLGASSFGQCEIDELFPLDGQRDDKVGWDSAISGNVAILGAPWDDDKGPDSGAAYFYRYNPNVDQWLVDAKILETDGTPHNEFGLSVGVDGSRAIIASPFFQATLHGVVYIYQYDPATKTWSEEALLTASDGVIFDEFGVSVAIDGDVIIVGAPRTTVNSSGRAYVFRYDPKRAGWIEEAILLSSAPINGDTFGYSVDIDGDVAIVASPGGVLAALVFRRDPSSGNWVEQANLTDKAFGGMSVAVFEDTALVGHPGYGVNGFASGAAFVYQFDPDRGTWELEQVLFPSDGRDGDYFGASLAVDGSDVVVGARRSGLIRGLALSIPTGTCPIRTCGSSKPSFSPPMALRATSSDDPSRSVVA